MAVGSVNRLYDVVPTDDEIQGATQMLVTCAAKKQKHQMISSSIFARYSSGHAASTGRFSKLLRLRVSQTRVLTSSPTGTHSERMVTRRVWWRKWQIRPNVGAVNVEHWLS